MQNIVLFQDEIKVLYELDSDTLEVVTRGILADAIGEDPPQMDIKTTAIYSLVLAQVHRARDVSQKRREAAKQKHERYKNSQEIAENKLNAMSTESVCECPYAEIMAMYNEICASFNKIEEMTGERRKALDIVWKGDIEKFKLVFQKAEKSEFLKRGGDKKIQFGFDWFIKPINFINILEGKYDDKKDEKTEILFAGTSFEGIDLDAFAMKRYYKEKPNQ